MKEVEKYYYDNVFESLSVNLLVTDSARMCTKTYVKIRLILRMPCNIILFSCSSLYVIPLKILRKLKEEKRNSFSIWLVFIRNSKAIKRASAWKYIYVHHVLTVWKTAIFKNFSHLRFHHPYTPDKTITDKTFTDV